MTAPSRSTVLLSIALALPAVYLGWRLWQGEPWRHGIDPSGDIAAKLLVVTLSIGPLARLAGEIRPIAWLLARRRILGLAAFGYALFHAVVFSASIGRLDWIVQGMAFASMWTGWIAFGMLSASAAISNRSAVVLLGRWWKRVQRLVYPAALLVLAHWLLLSASPRYALAHCLPVALLWILIAGRQLFRTATRAYSRR